MTDTNDETPNPYTRPWFIIAAIIVAIVVVLGVVLGISGIVNSQNVPEESGDTPATMSSAPTTSVPEATAEAAGDESICGLPGVELTGTVSGEPEAEWAYQNAIPYPTSSVYGPVSTEGAARTCYQHSPTGALFFAANAVAQGSDVATAEEWMEVAISQGTYRDTFLAQGAGADAGPGTRLETAGYRILNYDGERATVDIATRFSGNGENLVVSAVYYLVWEDGDWKIDANVATPMDAAPIPDLAGYTAWGA